MRRLSAAARAVIAAIGPELDGWRLVSLAMVRARTVRAPGPGWTGIIDYRARLLEEEIQV